MRLTSAKKYVIYFCDIKHVHRFINHIKNFEVKKRMTICTALLQNKLLMKI